MFRRRAWWSALKILFATVLGITHRVAARVSKTLRKLFFKRFLKMLESGIDPATSRFEVGLGSRPQPYIALYFYTRRENLGPGRTRRARWECGAKEKKVRIARGPLWGKASGEKPSRRVGVLMWEAEDEQPRTA